VIALQIRPLAGQILSGLSSLISMFRQECVWYGRNDRPTA
jgi:hypothetical protein